MLDHLRHIDQYNDRPHCHSYQIEYNCPSVSSYPAVHVRPVVTSISGHPYAAVDHDGNDKYSLDQLKMGSRISTCW